MAEHALAQQNASLSLIDTVDIGAVQTTLAKIEQFQKVVQNTLKENHDYGIIPGTDKPTLLKPGAEKIQMLFGVTSEYEVTERIQDYDKGFFAFTVRCTIFKNGMKITEGVGHCNTREKKYVNQDPYTLANTCLKMAKKRAQIDATLTIASLSEVFTQDMEDLQDYLQTEQIETMTPEEAGATKLTFGKFKGKTLKEIYLSDKSYLQWLVKQDRTKPVIKKAINIMFEAVEHQKQERAQQPKEQSTPVQNEANKTDKQEEQNPFDDAEPVEINDDEFPF
ncbi:exodeoxyribonuclease X C-terminal domain-containing protein [Weizmannia acidilactici]|uniref:exodeoxyribonuclease X C-terminal domain-containing protein n=1 Tax=Weizmannia acidilactici TaxID=2607726 RepID=UPI00124EAA4F|nr:hypothetical protein [Weizmannia acidilactici]GER73397.1 hypothetical protein BpPP18_14640 [Weizmannia acidilactici]